MFGRLAVLLALVIGSLSTVPGTSWAVTAEQLQQVDRAAADYVKSNHAAGLAVGIAVHGKPVFVREYGFANLELGVPVTEKSVFRVGSLTKQFTAVGILLLAEQGKLQVSDKLSKYFPDFPRGDEVTIADLLHHISGIHNYTESPDFLTMCTQTWPTAKLVDHIKSQAKLYDFDPGTQWHYSNSNYVLLGAIIEKVSGQTLAAFMKQHVFEPLGMKASAYDQDDEIVPDRAYGYDPTKDHHGFAVARYISITVPGGAGMLRTTVGDLLTWEKDLFGGKILSRESFSAMTTPARLRSGELASTHIYVPPGRQAPTSGTPVDYGYGIAIGHNDSGVDYVHNGDIFGYSSKMDHYPASDISIVVLTNTFYAANDLAIQIRKIVVKPLP